MRRKAELCFAEGNRIGFGLDSGGSKSVVVGYGMGNPVNDVAEVNIGLGDSGRTL